MFGLGPTELIVILVLVMLVFGVGKLPEVGAGLGKGIHEFKESISGRSNDDDDQDPGTRRLNG
ncbi:MAG: twin-arginine translocase TatA/TatE family subunit [Chloroflexota bacterium]|nr:twin-arginine translocase TatA/TatE family subunit [Chloroflexota bacterium]